MSVNMNVYNIICLGDTIQDLAFLTDPYSYVQWDIFVERDAIPNDEDLRDGTVHINCFVLGGVLCICVGTV